MRASLKIEDLRAPVVRQQNVGRFQTAVHDARCVRAARPLAICAAMRGFGLTSRQTTKR
jgi:hypothetical protein